MPFTRLFPSPVRERLKSMYRNLPLPEEKAEPEPEPEPEPEKRTYRVAVHYDEADYGREAAETAVAYIHGALSRIWPTEVVVGQELPPELTKDENYIPNYQEWARSDKPEVDAHQHVLVASTTGSHGWTSYCRVSHSDDLAELDPEWQKIGRGWNHEIVSTLLHEVAHGLGTEKGDNAPKHGDGTKIGGCQTPMDSDRLDCFAHVYSEKSAEKIRRYMEETVGYEEPA